MPSAPLARLLIVDDEAAQMKALCNTLEQEGYITTGFTSANEALAELRERPFDVLVTDLMMPEMDGISLLRSALKIDHDLASIVTTGHATVGTAVEAMKAGAFDYILKPFKLSEIRHVLTRSLATRRLRMENIRLRELVGIYELSTAVSLTLDCGAIVEKVADSAFHQGQGGNVSVLLAGPDGRDLRVAASRGPDAQRIQGMQVPIGKELSTWIARSRAALSKPQDTATFPELEPSAAAPMPEVPAGISVPMLSGGALVGILHFSPPVGLPPVSPGQMRALHILASNAAGAIEAAFLLEQLRDAEQRYRRLAENAPDIIFRYELRPHLGFTFINDRVTDITGYTPPEFYADPRLGFKIVHPDDRPVLESLLRSDSRSPSISTLRWLHKNGTVVWMEQRHSLVNDDAGRPLALECILRDVTERKRLEEQLHQAQKMEAVGRLAGGVAHDFNNLLTIINGYSAHALSILTEEDPLFEEIQQIIQAGERAASLTRQLLAFSRRQVLTPQLLDLNRIVADLHRMLRRVLGEDVELVTIPSPSLDSVHADRGQLEQVLMNLVVNSRYAMPNGGKLTIETANAHLNGQHSGTDRSVPPGRYVMLAVTDTGTGMSDEILSRIFEPFFTTKPQGQGTGLGLSTVFGIVKQSGGDIAVQSELGKGTTFRIYLPAIAQRPGASEKAQPSKRPVGGKETILVVEDEAAVRKLICSVLRRSGYQVLEAPNSGEALLLCDSHAGPIHLVVTDMVMPQMGGRELAHRITAQRPDTRVLFMSGYTDATVSQVGVLDGQTPFLQKPFTPLALSAKIRDVLDNTR